MILLITPSARGQQCADSLQAATGEETHWAAKLQEAASRLREQTYTATVIDPFLLETEPEEEKRGSRGSSILAPLSRFTSTSV